MKRNPKSAKPKAEAIQVWTLAQAQSAVPYITSIVRSLREHAINIQKYKLLLEKLNQLSGRPKRDTLIAAQEAQQDKSRAESEFQTAADELQTLDIYTLDPIRGQALVPFVHDEQLAWYIFDLFDASPFRFWRFQSDPEETRRPITTKQHGLVEPTSLRS
jgi:Uncharacterized conserved protein (DUF2203)